MNIFQFSFNEAQIRLGALLSPKYLTEEVSMQSVSIQDIQEVVVTAQPVDASGNPATNFNPATWAVDNPAIATVNNISSDGLTATVVAVAPGTANVTVTGEQGNFQPSYSTTFSVVVTPAVPVSFNFSFGTPSLS